MVAAAVVGAGVVGALASSSASKSAANTAANAQTSASQAGIAQQNSEFQQVQSLLQPYAQAGNGAIAAQQNLIGLNGADAQQQAITQLQNMPQYQSMLKAGNNSILANASATGGLRGGNTQAALAQYAPNLLASTIQQQYGNLGGLTSIGQNAAAGVGNAGMQTGNNITGLLGQIGSAQAGNALAGGAATGSAVNGMLGSLGTYAAMTGYGQYGVLGSGYGGSSASQALTPISTNGLGPIDPIQIPTASGGGF